MKEYIDRTLAGLRALNDAKLVPDYLLNISMLDVPATISGIKVILCAFPMFGLDYGYGTTADLILLPCYDDISEENKSKAFSVYRNAYEDYTDD